jgi:CBS domain-containing protein
MPRIDAFRRLVRDHMEPPPVVVSATMACRDVVARLSDARASAALVMGPDGRIQGILTEQDVVRRLAFRSTQDTPVADVMTMPVKTVVEDDYLYHSIARMRRFHLRHMPVVNAVGRPVGMLRLDAALAAAAQRLLEQVDALTQEGTIDGLREVKFAEIDLAEEMFHENVPAPEIQALLTHVNRDIHRRVIESTITSMADEGLGPPPVPFAFIIMGSGGRGESFLHPDQDNGLILEDYPDAKHNGIDAWFIGFSERVVRDLDAVGFPYCNGHVMATNPVWRKSISQWRAQINGWLRRRSTVALRLSDIFFDFRGCYGALDLVADLRDCITETLKANTYFLSELFHDDEDYGVPLGLFGRLITEKENAEHIGEINLKMTGTLPLVQAARLLALREGISEIATLDRLAQLHAAGLLADDEHDYLRGAFHHITALLLRQQIADFRAGKPVSNFIHPDSLSRRERDQLVDSFKAIRRFLDHVRSDFTGHVF